MSIFQDERFGDLLNILDPQVKKESRKKFVAQAPLTQKIREALAELLSPATQRQIEGMLGFAYKSTDVSSALAKMVRRGEVLKQPQIQQWDKPTPVNFYCLDVYRSESLIKGLQKEAVDKNIELKKWFDLRYEVLKESDGKCVLCGASAKDGAKLQVDHIKPKSKHPELMFEKSNLQVLCAPCNLGKSNKDDTDWR
jgi:5-methylcytosine-specific restriction endonuclease McrA